MLAPLTVALVATAARNTSWVPPASIRVPSASPSTCWTPPLSTAVALSTPKANSRPPLEIAVPIAVPLDLTFLKTTTQYREVGAGGQIRSVDRDDLVKTRQDKRVAGGSTGDLLCAAA